MEKTIMPDDRFTQPQHCAFPAGGDDTDGLSAIEYAAIALRVPESGTPWLDDMIRKARRMDAADAMKQFVDSQSGGE